MRKLLKFGYIYTGWSKKKVLLRLSSVTLKDEQLELKIERIQKEGIL